MPQIKRHDGTIVSYVDKLDTTQLKQQRYNLERKNDAKINRRDLDREKKLKELFKRSTDRLENNLNRYYTRYANKEGISLAEAKKRADEFDIRRWEQAAARAVKYKDFSPQTNSWLRLYNLKMRASREEAMLAQAGMDMVSLFAEFEDMGKQAVVDEAIRETERQAGILDGAPIVKEEVVRLVDSDFYTTGGFSHRIWGRDGHLHKLHRELVPIMTNMHVNQDGYRDHWKKLASRMSVAESNAKRLLLTEERRMIAKSQKEMYKKHDFDQYVYVAEAGACETCAPLDGLVFYTKEIQEGVNFPIIHPHCRCSTQGYKSMERLNQETDEWEMVHPDGL